MPIYEYNCIKCNNDFEVLVLSKMGCLPKCPKCDDVNVKKIISSGATRPHGIPKGSGGFKPRTCQSSFNSG